MMKTKTTNRNNVETRLKVLLRDYGYKMEGNLLISMAIRGFTSESIFGRYRDIYDAAERMVPIIRDDGYYTRFREICPA